MGQALAEQQRDAAVSQWQASERAKGQLQAEIGRLGNEVTRLSPPAPAA